MTEHLDSILAERNSTHGDFRIQFVVAQQLKRVIHAYGQHLSEQKKEALDMIAHKISRVLVGNPEFLDTWVDIAGYATIIADDIRVRSKTFKERILEAAGSLDTQNDPPIQSGRTDRT